MRIVCIALLVLCCGCLPSTRIKKNPCNNDTGLRFYRPKPYLFIKPLIEKDNKNPSDKFVEIEMQMLPDFSEEYSIHIRSGLGTNDTEVVLTEGWNLTKLNVDVDSQFDENFQAIATGISKFIPSESGGGGGGNALAGMRSTVPATNVPLGYYESVISRGPDGKKRLYGWRYIGFSPYAYCPQEVAGVDCQTDCQQRPLFGLVFENGTMTFKELPNARFANNVMVQTNYEKALKHLENEIANAVPLILQQRSVSEVSPQRIDVTTEKETETISVNAMLNEAQMDAYRKIDATDYEIAQAIIRAMQNTTGQELDIEFRVTKLNEG